MSDALDEFFSGQSEEDLRKKQEIIDGARNEESKSAPIALAGKYVCEVSTFAYRDKTNDNKLRISPEISMSDKGNITLLLNLKTVDSTPEVPKGSSIFLQIIVGTKGSETEGFEKIMAYTKPKLVALTGTEAISFRMPWLREWLTAEYKDEGKKSVLVRDHKMKQRVLVTVDESVYQDKVSMKVQALQKAMPNDKSITFMPKVVERKPVSAPVADSGNTLDYARVATESDMGGGDNTPSTPDIEEA